MMLACNSDHWAVANTRANRAVVSLALFPAIFVLFSLVTAIFFWQWIPHLNSALIGPPEDNQQDFWNTWYAVVGRNPDSGHFFSPT